MSTAEEHNLNKASIHAEEALTRLRTIQLSEMNLLTDFQSKMIDAYKNHLADIKDSIDEIREDVAQKREKTPVTGHA